MQLYKVPTAISDADIFSYSIASNLNYVIALNPQILIDTTISQISGQSASVLNGGVASNVNAFGLLNFADETKFVPLGSQKPFLVNNGSAAGLALRFGYGANLAGSTSNGYLVQEQSAQFGMGGSYTAGFVARRPTASEIGGVNPGAGPIIGANNTSAALSGLFLNYYTGFSVYHNGSPVGSATGEVPGTAIACLVSFDAIAHTVTIWQNGTVVGTASSVTTGWTAGNNLLIGAALFSGGAYYSVLDIAGVFLLCGTAVANGSSQALSINTWLNSCRSSVT